VNVRPFLAPVLLGFLLAVVAPVIALFGLAGFDWNLIDTPKWVGLDNFTNLNLGASLITTAWIALLVVVISVGLGGLLGYLGFKAIYLLPWFTAPIAIGVIWKWILAPTGGLLSTSLSFRVDLLSNDYWAPITVAAVISWCGIGYTALIFNAALNSVQAHTVDAAALDGAGRFTSLWRIQLPQIRRLVYFIVVTTTIQALTTYDLIYILTGGGPSLTTDVISIHVVNQALNTFQVGSASATSIAFLIFEVLILLVEYLVYRLVTRRFND
jgi:multiple sugar transport system permease protein